MKRHWIAGVAVSCLMAGVALGVASQRMAGIDTIRGKPAKEAGLAALTAAEQLAGDGSWERIAVGRVYYLSGDKTRGQAIFDAVTSGKQNGGDWQRIGEVYAAAGDTKQANESFKKMLDLNPKDDTGQAEVGAWYIRTGDRAKGEELFAKAFQRHPDEVWHYVRAAEALLGVPAGR